jgi:hypothetical protein
MLFLEMKILGFVDSQVVISLLTSHQLHVNDFELYLRNPLNDDSRNLFALRWDLHSLQFDQASFVIVPKCDHFAIHFLRRRFESSNLYHNLKFDHDNTLLHKLLYARFAWALFTIVKDYNLPEDLFNFDKEDDTLDIGNAVKKDPSDSKKRKLNDKSGGEGRAGPSRPSAAISRGSTKTGGRRRTSEGDIRNDLLPWLLLKFAPHRSRK